MHRAARARQKPATALFQAFSDLSRWHMLCRRVSAAREGCLALCSSKVNHLHWIAGLVTFACLHTPYPGQLGLAVLCMSLFCVQEHL